MVLSTDMSKHMTLLADLKTMVETKKVAGKKGPEIGWSICEVGKGDFDEHKKKSKKGNNFTLPNQLLGVILFCLLIHAPAFFIMLMNN